MRLHSLLVAAALLPVSLDAAGLAATSRDAEGVVVISISSRSRPTDPLLPLAPNDTLLYAGRWGLELPSGIQQTDSLGRVHRRPLRQQGYVLDFEQRRFTAVSGLAELASLTTAIFRPWAEKQYGLGLAEQFYHGEPYQLQAAGPGQVAGRLLRYTSRSDSSTYVVELLDGLPRQVPNLFADVERRFGGHVRRLTITTPAGNALCFQVCYRPGVVRREHALLARLR